MTKKTLLASILALGSVCLAPLPFASPALACGSYPPFPVDPDATAVREAVLRFAADQLGEDRGRFVYGIHVTDGRATAIVRVPGPGGRAYERDVRLVRRADAWRVVGFGPRRAIG